MKKKPSGKRPAMFYQDAKGAYSINHGPRIRIVYPNGKIEWGTLLGLTWLENNPYFFKTEPCYVKDYGEPHSFKSALKLMNKHDRKYGYSKAEFLGEL